MHRLLLRLYPASFRHEYGEEMSAIFARRLRDASGPLARAWLLVAVAGEIAVNAAIVHADILAQDRRYIARTIRRAPGFAMTAVAIVALGIGATTAAFSVTDFVLLRPLPFPEGHRLVKIWQSTPTGGRLELSPANYRDWTRASRSFERTGAYHPLAVNMIGRGEPLRLEGTSVSADLLPTLGVPPLVGRWFSEPDDRAGAAGTVIFSYRLWQAEFGGDPLTIGQSITLDNEPYTVIGVMPREFRFPTNDTSLWTTMRFTEEEYQARQNPWLEAVGRLRPGVTCEQARAELLLSAAQSRQEFPKENASITAAAFLLRDEISQRSRLLLVALFGAATCVLLIACANLASLLLARALGRRRELAVRTAIGAGRERLIRQLMTESLLLACAGGVVGVGLAYAALPLLAQLVPTSMPIAATPSVDLRVLLFAAALTTATGIAFGVAPVLRMRDDGDLSGLREGARAGGGRKERLRAALVTAEIIATIVLLVSAGLLLRTLRTVQTTDPGFKTDGVLTLRTALPLPRYAAVAARAAFYTRVLDEVRALPGVASAGYITGLPMSMRGGMWTITVPGKPPTGPPSERIASLRYVTSGFFDSLSIPIVRGRDVSDADDRSRPFVAVVSQSFVRRYFPDEDPIGRGFRFANADRVVAGVVGDVRFRGLEGRSEAQIYLPYQQVPDDSIIGYIPKDLVIRTTTAADVLMPSIRAIVRKVDPTQPISNVRMMSDIVDLETASRSAQLRVIVAFAVLAFLLAAVGIHGLLSFAVSERAQEIGVRMALGAQSSDILGMVVTRSLWLAMAGAIPGLALAYAAGRSMRALLVGVTPADVPTFAAVGALTIAMTVAGTLMPARRALRIDPINAIRTE